MLGVHRLQLHSIPPPIQAHAALFGQDEDEEAEQHGNRRAHVERSRGDKVVL